jgi:6-pyruvoyltetrahydropterin/6-carboxytetrahydropterin synthase
VSSPIYSVSKDLLFSGAHAITLPGGRCEARHGHNWRIRITVQATALDNLGMVMDFAELNETAPFDKLNPTAENIARLLFEGLGAQLNDARLAVRRVEVWETERSRAVVELP